MNRKERKYVSLPGFILLSIFIVLAVGTAASAADKPSKYVGGKCALCHAPVINKWRTLPHGGGRSRYGEETGATGARQPDPVPCTGCHESSLLKGKPIQPKESPKVCGRCHLKEEKRSAIVLNLSDWKNSKHAAAGLDCISCHRLHQPIGQPLLSASGDGLCIGCHAKLQQHQQLSVKVDAGNQGNCLSCHDPHGSKAGGLYASKIGGEEWQLRKATTHKPVAEGLCKDCHDVHQQAPVSGAGAAVQPPDDEEEEDGAAGESVSGRGGPNRSLLSKPSATICYKCHDDKRAMFAASKHSDIGQLIEPQKDNSCAACHLPHSSDYAYLTFYEGSRLCLTCHPAKTPHHFLAGASVQQRKLECVRCHNPHGSQNQAFLVRERKSICAMCHTK